MSSSKTKKNSAKEESCKRFRAKANRLSDSYNYFKKNLPIKTEENIEYKIKKFSLLLDSIESYLTTSDELSKNDSFIRNNYDFRAGGIVVAGTKWFIIDDLERLNERLRKVKEKNHVKQIQANEKARICGILSELEQKVEILLELKEKVKQIEPIIFGKESHKIRIGNIHEEIQRKIPKIEPINLAADHGHEEVGSTCHMTDANDRQQRKRKKKKKKQKTKEEKLKIQNVMDNFVIIEMKKEMEYKIEGFFNLYRQDRNKLEIYLSLGCIKEKHRIRIKENHSIRISSNIIEFLGSQEIKKFYLGRNIIDYYDKRDYVVG